jgi:hypothetical protein
MKAVVLEVKSGGRAIVLTEDGAFRSVALPRPAAVGQEVDLPPPTTARWPLARVAAVAAVGALLVVGGLRIAPEALAGPVAYVAVDIDPGLRLGVAADGTVTQVLASDPAARSWIGRTRVRGLPLDAAVDAVVAAAERQGYLHGRQGAVVLTAYAAPGKRLPPALRRALRAAAARARRRLGGEAPVLSLIAPAAVVAEADHSHVSPGQYALFAILHARHKAVSLADLRRARGLRQAAAEVATMVSTEGGASGPGRSPPTQPNGHENEATGPRSGQGADRGRHGEGGRTPSPAPLGNGEPASGGASAVVVLPGETDETTVSIPVDVPGAPLAPGKGSGERGRRGGGGGATDQGSSAPGSSPGGTGGSGPGNAGRNGGNGHHGDEGGTTPADQGASAPGPSPGGAGGPGGTNAGRHGEQGHRGGEGGTTPTDQGASAPEPSPGGAGGPAPGNDGRRGEHGQGRGDHGSGEQGRGVGGFGQRPPASGAAGDGPGGGDHGGAEGGPNPGGASDSQGP